MQIDRIEIVVRPRNAWESVDLGFNLIRQWWRPFYRIWFAFFLPLAGVLLLLFHQIPSVAMLILWWLKPLLDRIILYFLSRALFGEPPTIRQVWQTLPHLLFKTRLFYGLTLGRSVSFSP